MATTKRDFLNGLVKDNDLVLEEDIFKLQLGGKSIPIITRTGIEKIQYSNRIHIDYEVVSMLPDFVVIKATATMKQGDDTIKVETFGEASAKNTKQGYPVAMAEKRSLSRAVLKISGAYKFGVFGEDESDDFKRKGE